MDVFADSPFPTPGNPITVTKTYEYNLITLIMQALFGSTITASATAIRNVMPLDLADAEPKTNAAKVQSHEMVNE